MTIPMNRISALRALIVTAVSLFTCHAVAESGLVPFKATYQAQARGHSFTGVQQLTETSPGTFEFSFKASTKIAKVNENTVFTVENKRIRPLTYNNSRKIAVMTRDTKSKFDWDSKTVDVTYKGKNTQLDIENDELHSRLSYQLQIQLDIASDLQQLEYDVLSRRSIRHYVFVKGSDEVIDTPLGKFNTSVVEKVYDDDQDRSTKIWLARDYHFLIVKMDQREGEETSSLLIQSAEVNGMEISGS